MKFSETPQDLIGLNMALDKEDSSPEKTIKKIANYFKVDRVIKVPTVESNRLLAHLKEEKESPYVPHHKIAELFGKKITFFHDNFIVAGEDLWYREGDKFYKLKPTEVLDNKTAIMINNFLVEIVS